MISKRPARPWNQAVTERLVHSPSQSPRDSQPKVTERGFSPRRRSARCSRPAALLSAPLDAQESAPHSPSQACELLSAPLAVQGQSDPPESASPKIPPLSR